jgi:hypothetical protein
MSMDHIGDAPTDHSTFDITGGQTEKTDTVATHQRIQYLQAMQKNLHRSMTSTTKSARD